MATREERDLALRHAGIPRKAREAILDGGGGGFTHLIEDAGNADVVDGTGALITDLGIVVSADGSTFAETFLVLNPDGKINAYVDPAADGAYTLRRQGDDTNLFRINTDGSLEFGDGTDPPAAQVGTYQDFGGAVDDGGGVYVMPPGADPRTSDYVALGTDGAIQMQASIDGTATFEMYPVVSGGHYHLRLGYGPGSGFQLESPNGTYYNITVADDGTVNGVAA